MPITVRFTADDVQLEPQAGFIGFADSTTSHYFWMQPDEESSGKNGIWLERDDQQWGGTGERWSITVSPSFFSIDTAHLPWMECDSIEISFSIDGAKYKLLKELLAKAMSACPADLQILDTADHNQSS